MMMTSSLRTNSTTEREILTIDSQIVIHVEFPSESPTFCSITKHPHVHLSVTTLYVVRPAI